MSTYTPVCSSRPASNMQAAIYSGIGKIGVRSVSYDSPAPGYVLLDTKCTGIITANVT